MEKNKEYSLKELCEMEYANNKLILPLGWINKKERVYMNFKSISALFIGGATGTGKSIFIDDLILSLMYKNTEDDDSKLFRVNNIFGGSFLCADLLHTGKSLHRPTPGREYHRDRTWNICQRC